jgi:hypothetical protein
MHINVRSVAVLALMSLPLVAGAQEQVVGPYLQDIRPDGVVVAWETETETTGALVLEKTDGGEPASIMSDTPATRHELHLTGLDPATTYKYQVQVNGEPSVPEGFFTTAPLDKAPFTFLLYGDTRSDPNAHAQVLARMMEHPASFVVHTGDMVAKGIVEEQWREFFGTGADMFRDMPLYLAIGNHEEDNKQPPPPYLRMFVAPGKDAAHNNYYSFKFSNSRFIVLDNFASVSVDMDCIMRTGAFEECLDADQYSWLVNELYDGATDPDTDHVFVMVHMGPYSSKPNRSGSAEIRSLLNLFARSKVRAVFSGHDHYYEHGLSQNRLHYVISGGGGAPLYETDAAASVLTFPREILVSTSVYNFQTVRVDGNEIEVVSWEPDGSELERFFIEPRPACDVPLDCALSTPGTCEGEWECHLGECLWACTPVPQCEEALDCDVLAPPDGVCDGAWACEERQCTWQCAPAPECISDPDCQDRQPPESCIDGRWICVEQICEPDCLIVPGDPGPGTPDAFQSDEGQAQPDAGPSTDLGTVPAGDDGAPDPTPKSSGGSCSLPAGGPVPAQGIMLVIAAFGLAAGALRRRK